jgi:hypothetical protein
MSSRGSVKQPDLAKEYGIEYIHKVPARLPEGKVLVHNRVSSGPKGERRSGEGGFRFWLAAPNPERQAPCDCPWAPNVGQHYRTKLTASTD